MNRAIYIQPGYAETEQFFDSALSEAVASADGAALDSVSTRDAAAARVGSAELPERMRAVLDAVPESERTRVLDSVLVGMKVYKRDHGCLPTADLIEAALQQGIAASRKFADIGVPNGAALDNVGSTEHHNVLSSQPNRVIVAITSAIAEAIPFATYLPTDIGSNEARLAIVSHLAGSTFGAYSQGAGMDGIAVGEDYASSARRVELTLDAERDAAAGKIGKTTGASPADMKLLRGRTIIFVNGLPSAYEVRNTNAAVASPAIAGTATIGGTDYAVSGTVTVDTGVVALAFSPALPVGTIVEAEGYADFERDATMTPQIITQVTNYELFACPWRTIVKQSIDSATQYQNELSLDLLSESVIALRNQVAMERHYKALKMALAIAKNFATTYDFNKAAQIGEKNLAMILQDFSAVLGVIDQEVCERTMDHGLSHLYVGKKMAALFLGLPSNIFAPSGLQPRPGVYRLGTLWGRYEVYYTPKLLTEGATTAQILCIGRSAQVARCPLVLGDAVAPTIMPLAFGDDFKKGNGFYGRNFTHVNPHIASASGVALINVINL